MPPPPVLPGPMFIFVLLIRYIELDFLIFIIPLSQDVTCNTLRIKIYMDTSKIMPFLLPLLCVKSLAIAWKSATIGDFSQIYFY